MVLPYFRLTQKHREAAPSASVFLGDRVQAAVAGTLHSGFPQRAQCTFQLSQRHVCFHRALSIFLVLYGTAWNMPSPPLRRWRHLIFYSCPYPHTLKYTKKFGLCYVFLSKPQKPVHYISYVECCFQYSIKLQDKVTHGAKSDVAGDSF